VAGALSSGAFGPLKLGAHIAVRHFAPACIARKTFAGLYFHFCWISALPHSFVVVSHNI